MSPTVCCLLKRSKDFRPEYVYRLFEQVRKNWQGELDFLCLTDTPLDDDRIREIPLEFGWPGYWSKLEIFKPGVTGDLFYFDLDTMVTGSLAEFQKRLEHHTMLRAFKWKNRIASGLMYLPEEVRPVIWERWILAPKKWMRVHHWPNSEGHLTGDQGFMQETWERSGWGSGRTPDEHWQKRGILRFQKEFPGRIVSYKKHVRKNGCVPPRARIVCFHGPPRPHELDWRLP